MFSYMKHAKKKREKKKKMWSTNHFSFCRVTCNTNEFTGLAYHISQQIVVSAYTWEQCVQGWVDKHPELTRKGYKDWHGCAPPKSRVPLGAELILLQYSLFPCHLALLEKKLGTLWPDHWVSCVAGTRKWCMHLRSCALFLTFIFWLDSLYTFMDALLIFFLSSRPLSVPGECRCQCKVWQSRVVEVLPACFRDTRCAALVPRHHLYGIRGTSTGGSGIVTLLVLGIVIRRVLSKCRATLKTVTAGQGKISVVLV